MDADLAGIQHLIAKEADVISADCLGNLSMIIAILRGPLSISLCA